MADNRVQYLIDILPNTSELKKKLKANDVLNFSDISDIKKLIIDEVKKATSVVNKEAPKMRNAIQNGLSIDTSDLQKKLEFITGLMGDLEKAAPMENWTKRGKGVYDTFVNLQHSVGALAKDVKVLQDSLGSLTTSFEGFKKSYQSFNPTQFVKVGEEVKRVNDKVVTGMGQIATVSTKVDSKLQKTYNSAVNLEKELKSISSTKVTFKSLKEANAELSNLEKQHRRLYDDFDPTNLKQIQEIAVLEAKIKQIVEFATANKNLGIGFSINLDSKQDVKDYLDNFLEGTKAAERYITQVKTKYEKTLGQVGKDASPDALINQLKDVKLSLRVPSKSELVDKINTLVDSIKPKDLHSIQTNIIPTLDDAANIIEDKSKRAYNSKSGENPASDDAVTDGIVTKTQNRFTRLEEVINASRERITNATEKWRTELISKFQIGKNDLKVNFKWQGIDNANTLWNDLQDYFDKNAIDINVSFKNLSKQIEGALQEQNIILGSGGTANIDPNAIMNAVYQGMVAAFTGQALPVNVINTQEVASSVDSQAQNDTPKQAGNVPESSIKLDRDVAQKSLELLKQIAKIATKTKIDKDGNTVSAAPKGVKKIEALFSTLGLKLTDIVNETNDDVIFTKLQDALTRVDEKTGLVIGRTIGRTLQETDYLGLKISGPRSAGFIAEALGRQIEELLHNAGVKTESGDEATKRARRLSLLDDIRAKNQQYYPAYQAFDKIASNTNFNKFVKNPDLLNIEDIDAAITQLEAVGGNNAALKSLKDARLQLGDSKDLDALEKFKAHAYNFLEQSKDVYKWLNDHMGNFKGTVYRPGRRPWNVNNAAGIANLPQDAKIDDVTIYRAFGQNYKDNPDMVARPHRTQNIELADIKPTKFYIKERNEKDLEQTVKSQESTIKNIPKLTKSIKQHKKDAEELAQTVEKIKNDITTITIEVPKVSLDEFTESSNYSKTLNNIIDATRTALSSNTVVDINENDIKKLTPTETELVKELQTVTSSINNDVNNLENVNNRINAIQEATSLPTGDLDKLLGQSREHIGGTIALKGLTNLRNSTLPMVDTIRNVIKQFTDMGLDTTELDKLEMVASQYHPFDNDSEAKDKARVALEEAFKQFIQNTNGMFDKLVGQYGKYDIDNEQKQYNLYHNARWNPNALKNEQVQLGQQAQTISARISQSQEQGKSLLTQLEQQGVVIDDQKQNEALELANRLREVREKLYKEANGYVKILGKNPDDQVAFGKLQQVLGGLQSNAESFAKIEHLVDVPLYDKKTQIDNINKWTKKYLKDTPSVLGSAKGKLTAKTEELDELNKTLAITEAKKRLAEDVKKQHISDEKELNFVKQYNELLRQEKELLEEINNLQKQGADRKTIGEKYSERYAVDSEIKTLLQNNPDDNRHAYGFNEAIHAQNDLSSLALQRRVISNDISELKALENELKSAKFFSGERAKKEVEALKTTVADKYRQQLIDEINKDFGPVDSLTAAEKEKYNDEIRKTITQRREYRNSLEVQDNQLVHKYIDRDEKDNPIERFKPVVEDLKQTLLNIAKIPESISRLQEQAKPIDERMRTAYASKQEAMRYGGVTQTELKNSPIVQDREKLLKEVEASQSRIKTLDERISKEEKAIEDKTIVLKDEVDRLKAKKKTDGQLSAAEEALLKETQSQLTKLTKPITDLKNQRARVQQELDDKLGFVKNRENIIAAKEIEKESRQKPSIEAQLAKQTEVLNKKKAEQVKLDEQIAQLNKDKKAAGKDTPEAERIRAEIADKKAEKKALDEEIKNLEARSVQLQQNAQKQKENKIKYQKHTTSSGTTIPIAEGSIFGQLVSAVRDGLSDLRATISDEDLTLLAKDATLQSIIKLLGGDGSVGQPQLATDEVDDNTGYSKNSRKKKLSRTQVTDDTSNEQILAILSNVGEQINGWESRLLKLEEETVGDQKTVDATTSSFVNTAQPGGIVGIMNTQAELLKQILMTVGEISKKQIGSGVAKANSADDMLARLKQVLGISIAQDKERFMQIDTTTGAMSESVDGKQDEINGVLLSDMKKVVQKVMNPDMNVHTHGQSNNPDDQYFSDNDMEQIIADFKEGIKKQLLVSEQGLALIDLSKITDINDVKKLFAKQKGGKASFDALQNNDSIKYSTRTWEGITPQKLVNFLGIEGVESKLNATETKDAAIQGVAEEAAKEAAQVVQKSTGAAIKTTFNRIGLEMAKSVEQTDTKGNKTWSTDISNKYQKAMEATYKDIASQNLGDIFGKGTDAQKALVEYENHYTKLNELVEQFKTTDEGSKAGIQAQINELIPTFDKAEKKLLGLIARKDKFLGDDKALDATFGAKELASPRKNLEKLARQMYGGNVNPGGNVAFGGYKRGQGSGQLFVDVLDGQTKTIKTHVLEVDKATGKVKEYTLAENALSNAFQNVNRAMKQNEFVLADVAMGDGPKKQAEWLANASSPHLDAYKNAFNEMQNYTAQLWNSGKAPSQQQLDYLMQLSERVMVLGKELQKTSGDFKNFWAQNPDAVRGIDFHEGDTVRTAMERYAQANASANTSKYEFTSFDNNTLKYKLTDVEGNVRNVSMVWDELYQKIAVVSDKSVVALDPLVAKIEKYKQTVADAKANGYLLDIDDADFNAALQEIEELQKKVKEGTVTYDKLEEARRKAIKVGSSTEKLAKDNEKKYAGTNELRSAERQNTKILGTLPETFNTKTSKQFKVYQNAYDNLIAKHKEFADNNKMASTDVQKQLQRDAAAVQKLGKQFLASANEAQMLQEAVDNSGSFVNKQGKEIQLGGIKGVSPEEMKNLNGAMRAYAQEVLGAELAHAKFNPTTQQLTGVIRQNNRVVSDMVVKYNEATGQMYLFQKQERESLSGLPGLLHGLKEKSKAIVQYLASMTSIYRVFSMLRQGLTYVKEIDLALTELKKVTDETEKTYDKFLETASKTAAKVGSTIKEVVSSTADFARLGYTLKEAAVFAESAQILMNVSEFTDVSRATDTLISAVQAFGYTAETSLDVVDMLNMIGNNYAISTADLAQSLTKSSASLVAAGGNLAEAAALTATANKIIQDADSVGTALKTTSLRLRGTSVEILEEEGLDSDGAVTSKSKLQSKVKALSGVDILTATGEYKSTYEILSQIADVWSSINDMDQAALLELISGKRNSSVIAAILQNPKELKEAFEDANNAEGSALKENEKYLDSIQGRIDLLTNAIQTMWSNALDSDVVKFFVDLLTKLVQVIDKLGLIPSLLIAISTISMVKHRMGPLAFFTELFSSLQKAPGKIKELAKSFVSVPTAASKAAKAIKDLTISVSSFQETMAGAGLDAKQQKAVLSQLGLDGVNSDFKLNSKQINADNLANLANNGTLNKTQVDQLASVYGLKDAYKELNAEQMKNALSNMNLSDAQKANMISTLGLEDGSKLLTQGQITQAAASAGLTEAEGAQAVANVGLTATNTGLAASFKALWTAMFPVLLVMLAIAAVVGIVKFFDAIIKTSAELREELSDLKSEISDVKSEIDALNDELKTTQERMAELLAKESLTFTEQEELENLQKQNDLLERQISLLELKEKRLQKEAQGTFDKIMEKETKEKDRDGDGEADIYDKSLDKNMRKYEEWAKEYEEAEQALIEAEKSGDEKAIKRAQKRLEKTERKKDKFYGKVDEELNQYLEDAEGIDYASADEETRKYLDYIYNVEGSFHISNGDAQAKTLEIKRIFNKDNMSGVSKEINTLVEQLSKNPGDQSIISQISEQCKLAEKDLNAVGLSVQDAVDYFTQLGTNAGFDTLDGKIAEISKATTALETLLNGGQFNVEGKNIGLADLFTNEGKVIQTKLSEIFKGTSSKTREAITGLLERSYDDIQNGTVNIETLLGEFASRGSEAILSILEATSDTFEEISENMDKIQDSYSTLSNAVEQYNSAGFLTLDNLQSLLSLEPEYLALLQMENGQLTINQAGYEALVQTKLAEAKASVVQSAMKQLNALAAKKEADATNEASTAAANSISNLGTYANALSDVAKNAISAASSVYAFNNAVAGAQANELVTQEEIDAIINNMDTQLQMIDSVGANLSTNFGSIMTGGEGGNPKDGGEDSDEFEKLLKKHQNELDAIAHEKDLIQAEIDEAEAKGFIASEEHYKRLIDLEQKEKETLIQHQQKLQEFYDANSASMSADEIDNWNAEMRATALAIKECDINMIEFGNTIREIGEEYFNKVSEEIDGINEEIEFMHGLLEDEPVADENGNWSNEGLTRLGLYTQQMEKASFEAQRYQEEIDKLNAEYANGTISETEYQERLAELTSGQRDAINSYNDAKDGIVELNEARVEAIKEGIEKEIEAYNDLIENKKEALDAERDLYDFKKNIEEQNKSIADTERKLAALSGSTAAEDIAERKRLEAELRKQQGNLDDTYYDHSMTAQQNALDEESRYFEEAQQRRIESLEAMLENTEELIVNSMMDVMLNADIVHNTLNEQANTYGVTLSKELTQPWLDASAQAIAWRDELKRDMTEGEWAAMIGEGGAITAFSNGVATKLGGSWDTAKTKAKAYSDFLTGTELKNNLSGAVTTFTTYLQKIVDKWNEIRNAAVAATSVTPTVPSGGTGGGSGGNSTPSPSPTPASKKEEPEVKLRSLMQTSREMILGSKSFVDANTETINGVKYYRDSNTGYYYKISDLNSNRKYDGGRTTGWAIPKGTWFYTKHAKGTLGTTKDEWAITDEPQFGDELVLVPGKNGNLSFMRKGTGVVPADMTQKLFELAQIPTSDLMSKNMTAIVPNITKNEFKNEFNFDSLVHVDHCDQNTLKDLERMVDNKINQFGKQMNYALKGIK